jgi:hypothetical protein
VSDRNLVYASGWATPARTGDDFSAMGISSPPLMADQTVGLEEARYSAWGDELLLLMQNRLSASRGPMSPAGEGRSSARVRNARCGPQTVAG